MLNMLGCLHTRVEARSRLNVLLIPSLLVVKGFLNNLDLTGLVSPAGQLSQRECPVFLYEPLSFKSPPQYLVFKMSDYGLNSGTHAWATQNLPTKPSP